MYPLYFSHIFPNASLRKQQKLRYIIKVDFYVCGHYVLQCLFLRAKYTASKGQVG